MEINMTEVRIYLFITYQYLIASENKTKKLKQNELS